MISVKQQTTTSGKTPANKPRAKQAPEAPRDLLLSTASERERLHKLLHDGLGQVLTSATFLVTSLRHRLEARGLEEAQIVDEVLLLLNEAIAESRTLAARCEPPPKDVIGNTVRPSAAL
jgi:signal transduction histidine kinase